MPDTSKTLPQTTSAAMVDGSWATRLGELLVEAASLGVEHELDVDAFMQGAWRAYLDARPGLKEHLEEMQLLQQLETAREAGKLAQA